MKERLRRIPSAIDATRAIYETTVDEDVQPGSNANQCPECGGRVATNTVETACDDCGLVTDDQSVDSDAGWRSNSGDNRERCIPPATQGMVSADE